MENRCLAPDPLPGRFGRLDRCPRGPVALWPLRNRGGQGLKDNRSLRIPFPTPVLGQLALSGLERNNLQSGKTLAIRA